MIISLCSGYGGLDRAVAAAFRLPIGAHAEPEKIRLRRDGPLVDNAVLRVLEARFPGVPNLGDIRETDWAPWAGLCKVLCAGFPCQPVSAAGRQLAENDERWLWPAVHRAALELAPEWIVLENVANIVSIQGGAIWRMILDDLRVMGYDVAWGVFGACLIGACHHRHRMFLVARRGAGREALRWAGKACGVGRVLLPTPRAIDGARGPVDPQRTADSGRKNGVELASALVELLPTPQARDGMDGGDRASEFGGVRPSGSKRAVSLQNAIHHTLLSTPRATDGTNGGPGQRGSSGDLAMPSAVQPEHWGRFAAAVARHADRFGAPPAPTEVGPKGGVRMAAPFPEWMMGLAPGYVTGLLPRNDALRAIGNGVMPQQGYHAIGVLRQMLGDDVGGGDGERHAAGSEGEEPVPGVDGAGSCG